MRTKCIKRLDMELRGEQEKEGAEGSGGEEGEGGDNFSEFLHCHNFILHKNGHGDSRNMTYSLL